MREAYPGSLDVLRAEGGEEAMLASRRRPRHRRSGGRDRSIPSPAAAAVLLCVGALIGFTPLPGAYILLLAGIAATARSLMTSAAPTELFPPAASQIAPRRCSASRSEPT